jgi:excisionase family DNA binding protein
MPGLEHDTSNSFLSGMKWEPRLQGWEIACILLPFSMATTPIRQFCVIISNGGVIMTDKRWKAVSTKPRTVTIDKAAEVLSVSTTTIQQMMRDGQLHGIKRGRVWRILRSELEPLVSKVQKSNPS